MKSLTKGVMTVSPAAPMLELTSSCVKVLASIVDVTIPRFCTEAEKADKISLRERSPRRAN